MVYTRHLKEQILGCQNQTAEKSNFTENMNHDNETLPSTTSTTGTYFTYHITRHGYFRDHTIFTLVRQVRQLLHHNLTLIDFATN
ncbi:hypothetical protein DOY81_008106, partial [Sarcophaga bullata]